MAKKLSEVKSAIEEKLDKIIDSEVLEYSNSMSEHLADVITVNSGHTQW